MTSVDINAERQSAFQTHPDHRIRFEPARKRIRVVLDGVSIVESRHAMVLRETRHVPVYYFPRHEVRMDLMQRTDHSTYCPFKGDAAYWSVRIGDRTVENVMWSYEDPFPEVGEIRDYVALYRNRSGDWFIEADGGDVAAAGFELKAEDGLLKWLLGEAWNAGSGPDLTRALGQALAANGMPVRRLSVGIWSLHPQTVGSNYVWTEGDDTVAVQDAPHDAMNTTLFLDSPFRPLFEGAEIVRVDLTAESLSLDRPLLRELKAEGMTDYLALPLYNSDGMVNGLSVVTDRPAGFDTGDVERLRSMIHVLAQLFEVHTQRDNVRNLLDTYLGPLTGERVLHGLIRRGDSETLDGAVWFSDLRGSTGLAATMDREEYLILLNAFFEANAEAIQAQGGEVLRFIGDAVLAIFPVTDVSCPDQASSATARALMAATDAQRRIATWNRDRDERPKQAAGIALHFGGFAYGNVGTERRLDFTVVGTVVNEAARLADLCARVHQPIVMSESFRNRFRLPLMSLGRHTLRGVVDDVEVFVPCR